MKAKGGVRGQSALAEVLRYNHHFHLPVPYCLSLQHTPYSNHSHFHLLLPGRAHRRLAGYEMQRISSTQIGRLSRGGTKEEYYSVDGEAEDMGGISMTRGEKGSKMRFLGMEKVSDW